VSRGESPGSEEDANQRTARSGRKLECICSAKGSEGIRSQNEMVHEYEDPEDLFDQHG